jgi:hypothetical protein
VIIIACYRNIKISFSGEEARTEKPKGESPEKVYQPKSIY